MVLRDESFHLELFSSFLLSFYFFMLILDFCIVRVVLYYFLSVANKLLVELEICYIDRKGCATVILTAVCALGICYLIAIYHVLILLSKVHEK